jgi:hypothetical protein
MVSDRGAMSLVASGAIASAVRLNVRSGKNVTDVFNDTAGGESVDW